MARGIVAMDAELFAIASPQGSGALVSATARVFAESATASATADSGIRLGAAWRCLTDDQRLALVESCCTDCGALDPRCYCARDD
jgi:hypothetical protein